MKDFLTVVCIFLPFAAVILFGAFTVHHLIKIGSERTKPIYASEKVEPEV